MAPNFKNIKFGRRKSQGTSVEESSPTGPVSSFRVIPREGAGTTRKSSGNALDLRKAATYQPQRQSSYEEDSGSSNRGSNSSASTAARSHLFDNSNTRFSSTSTLQSPMEAMRKDRSPSPRFLKLGDDFVGEDWGNMFSGMENRRSALLDENSLRPGASAVTRTESTPVLSNLPKAFANGGTSRTPPPLSYRDSREMTASPSQWDRRNSKDRLISSPVMGSAESPTDDEPMAPPVPAHKPGARDSKPYTYFQLNDPSDTLEGPPTLQHKASIRSNDSYAHSGENEDADAIMVKNSVRSVRASTIGPSGTYHASPLARNTNHLAPPNSQTPTSSNASTKTASSSSSTGYRDTPSTPVSRARSPVRDDTAYSTPRANKALPMAPQDDDTMFDAGMIQAIQNANTRDMLGLPTDSIVSTPRAANGAKVMSMAEFNKQKASLKHISVAKPEDDSDSDNGYEDDDDDPIVRAQRRRIESQKEAQHAVWRQKMKKEIGDHSSFPSRPEYGRANASAPNLMVGGEPLPDDEDDDVPLAILQAHNFPTKTKNPDPRNSQGSHLGVQQGRPGTPTRASTAGQRASQLPVFARRLPEDPYFGASDLAAPSNRESLSFNKGRSQSVYGGGPPPGASPVPGLPPGGLVGVIAEEERARGARRGSPTGGNGYGYLPQGSVPMMPVMGGGQDQIRNQQMLELMQQNSFMMKEMMEMRAQMQMFSMGGTGMPMPGLPPMNPSRPMSMAGDPMRMSAGPGSTYGRTMSFMGTPNFPQQAPSLMNGRTMSMGLGLQNGYAASVAPSERSNIGQPSRYKPVNFADGGSTITAGSTPRLTTLPSDEALGKKKSGFLSAVMHSGKKSVSKVSNDDEEEGWGAPRKRR